MFERASLNCTETPGKGEQRCWEEESNRYKSKEQHVHRDSFELAAGTY